MKAQVLKSLKNCRDFALVLNRAEKSADLNSEMNFKSYSLSTADSFPDFETELEPGNQDKQKIILRKLAYSNAER